MSLRITFAQKKDQFFTISRCCYSVTKLYLDSMNPWIAELQASLSSPISLSLLKLTLIKSVMPSNHLTLCHPLLLLPSIFPSIRVFSRVSPLHHVDELLDLQLQHIQRIFRVISFRIDWFDLAVQGSLSSLLQHHSLKGHPRQCWWENSPANALDVRDVGSIPDLERSLKKSITTHSSVLAWRSNGQRSLASYSP